jgi:Bacterial capsule synthesis protein PGA_cap
LTGEIKAVTAGAPLIVNLEGVVLDEPPEGIGAGLHVMYASLAAPILLALNVKVAGLANSHSFDLGAAGIAETRKILERSAIAPLGHKEIVDVGPFRLLGLNFIGKLDYRGYPVARDGDLDDICRMQARPPLLALVHWGHEYTTTTGAAEYAAAQAMQACGVGAIIGAHPHQAAARIEAPQGGCQTALDRDPLSASKIFACRFTRERLAYGDRLADREALVYSSRVRRQVPGLTPTNRVKTRVR